MKKVITWLTMAILISDVSFSQEIDWKKATNWRLYEIRDFEVFDYPIDTLKNFRTIVLDQDTMNMFLTRVLKWPKEKTSVWMGLYFATCETSDYKIRKVEISVYGGFFYDECTKTYYQLPEEISTDWIDFLASNIERISLQ